VSTPQPCQHCGQPSPRRIAAEALYLRLGLELLLDDLGRPAAQEVNEAINWLIALEREVQ